MQRCQNKSAAVEVKSGYLEIFNFFSNFVANIPFCKIVETLKRKDEERKEKVWRDLFTFNPLSIPDLLANPFKPSFCSLTPDDRNFYHLHFYGSTVEDGNFFAHYASEKFQLALSDYKYKFPFFVFIFLKTALLIKYSLSISWLESQRL